MGTLDAPCQSAGTEGIKQVLCVDPVIACIQKVLGVHGRVGINRVVQIAQMNGNDNMISCQLLFN